MSRRMKTINRSPLTSLKPGVALRNMGKITAAWNWTPAANVPIRSRVTHDGTRLWLRSQLELKCYRELKELGLSFTYETLRVPYKRGRKCCCYIPDFIVGNLIIECKPANLLTNKVVVSKQKACLKAGYKYVFYTGKIPLAFLLEGI